MSCYWMVSEVFLCYEGTCCSSRKPQIWTFSRWVFKIGSDMCEVFKAHVSWVPSLLHTPHVWGSHIWLHGLHVLLWLSHGGMLHPDWPANPLQLTMCSVAASWLASDSQSCTCAQWLHPDWPVTHRAAHVLSGCLSAACCLLLHGTPTLELFCVMTSVQPLMNIFCHLLVFIFWCLLASPSYMSMSSHLV